MTPQDAGRAGERDREDGEPSRRDGLRVDHAETIRNRVTARLARSGQRRRPLDALGVKHATLRDRRGMR